MNNFDDLPLIKCQPQEVPVGHPEHPDFRGYEGTSGEDYPTLGCRCPSHVSREPEAPPLRGFNNISGWVIEE